jgi:hypothetical protein
MWSCNAGNGRLRCEIWQEAAEERGMVNLNAACPRMHTEGVREMARRTRIKPAYQLHAGRCVAAKHGLVFQLGPPPLVAVAVVGHER